MDLYDFPMGYRGIGFNGHRGSTGLLIPNSEVDIYRVTAFDFSRLQQRDQREPLHLLSGGDLGDATLPFRYLSIGGMIRAANGARLDDMIAALEAAFDVEEAQRSNPTTDGISAFTFIGLTEFDTGQGTAFTDEHGSTGQWRVNERFYGRPAAYAIVTGRRSGGNSANFAAELVCPDRRRYISAQEQVQLTGANGFTATARNWSASQGIAVPPLISIVMSGAGSNPLSIDVDGAPAPLTLNMSGESAGTFTVDMATGIIKKGSLHRQDLRTSAVDTLYRKIPPGGCTVSATGTVNVTSIEFQYRQARG